MKLYLFSSDSDTLTGLRLAGIDGCLVQSEQALCDAIAARTGIKALNFLLILINMRE